MHSCIRQTGSVSTHWPSSASTQLNEKLHDVGTFYTPGIQFGLEQGKPCADISPRCSEASDDGVELSFPDQSRGVVRTPGPGATDEPKSTEEHGVFRRRRRDTQDLELLRENRAQR